jgi:hypothetical protein
LIKINNLIFIIYFSKDKKINKENFMEKVNITTQMEKYTRENLKMVNLMDTDNIFVMMDINIWV